MQYFERGHFGARFTIMAQARKIRTTYAKAVFRTPAAKADEAAGILVAKGALGCAVREPGTPGSPRKVVALEAWFRRLTPSGLAAIRRAMAAAGMLTHASRRGGLVRTVADPGWATMWRTRFAPFRVGRRFLIVPPWSRRIEPGRIRLVIKPGRAFGTGHHPTTSGALRAIERLVAQREFRSALDVGTGSGLLAIAMSRSGIRRVVAIDIDPTALDNATENAHLNGVASGLRLSPVPLSSIRGRFDLVTANILTTILIDLAAQLAKRVAPGGRLVLGGILASEAAAVRREYRRFQMRCLDSRTSRGWATLVLAR